MILGCGAFIAALWLVHSRKRITLPSSDQCFFRVPLQATTVYRGWIPSAAVLREAREKRWDKDERS